MILYHRGRRLVATFKADESVSFSTLPVLAVEDGSRFTPAEFVRAGVGLVTASDAERKALAAWLSTTAPTRGIPES